MWQELDYYLNIGIQKPTELIVLCNFIKRWHIFKFLAGLNLAFDHVRRQILGCEKRPNLDEVILIALNEESHKELVLSTQHADNITFVVKSGHTINPAAKPIHQPTLVQRKTQKLDYRDNLWCTYCRRPRHTRDRCYKPYGKPWDFNSENGVSQVHPATNPSTTQTFDHSNHSTSHRNVDLVPLGETEQLHLELQQLKLMVVQKQQSLGIHKLVSSTVLLDFKLHLGTMLDIE